VVCLILMVGSTRIATIADGMFKLVASSSGLFGSISMADMPFPYFQVRCYYPDTTDIPLRLT